MESFKTHWTQQQRDRLVKLMDSGAWIGYWNSDAWGRPANGGSDSKGVKPGMVQQLFGMLPKYCGRGAYHATRHAHQWQGVRVWMVALLGEVKESEDKAWSLTREILGEILPEEACFDGGLAGRLGIKKLAGVDLEEAYLVRFNLFGANLSRANLVRANLRGANLRGANLRGANLRGANLRGTDLFGADLEGANLRGTDLREAVLEGVYLGIHELPKKYQAEWQKTAGYLFRK